MSTVRTMMEPRRVYRSSEVVLGPSATSEEAADAVEEQARRQGHDPLPGTVRVEERMPPLAGEVVRHRGKRIPMTADEFRDRQHGIVFRWGHTLHTEVVGTRWWGYVQVR